MRTIIAGSRTIRDPKHVDDAVKQSGFTITEVVCGGALGVDVLGYKLARKLNIPVKVFLPDWEKHGRAAGIIRNRQMGDYAQALIAVWDGKSRGTKHMIDYAHEKGLQVYSHRVA